MFSLSMACLISGKLYSLQSCASVTQKILQIKYILLEIKECLID